MQFDYIIVGGGSAGCVLANRLSSRAANDVMLIEAGVDTPPGEVPADILETFPKAALNPLYKWMKLLAYTQPLRRNVPGPLQPVLYDQGRVMGGGSSINFQAANRGAPEDYDEWPRLGAAGWGWSEVLPYFRKLEDDADFEGPLHGAGGPLPVQRMPRAQWCGFADAVAKACEAAGLGYIEDQNSSFLDGHFAAAQSNLSKHRVSAAMAYLDRQTRQRSNLQIMPETHVQEILFDGRRAVGVRAMTKQGTETFRGREIILSLGAVHTPALLMRSGVGPAQALSDVGIGVLGNVPGVGENLRDHPGVAVLAYLTRGARMHAGNRTLQVALRYSSGLEGCPAGDMYASVMSKAGWHGLGWRLGMIMTWVNKAYSVGRVSLRSPDWRDEPTVELNLCEDPRDLERLAAGIRHIASLYDRGPLQRVTRNPFCAAFTPRARAATAVNSRNRIVMGAAGWLLDGPAPLRSAMIRRVITRGPNLKALLDDTSALEDFVRETAMGIKHLSCTCRMGDDSDPLAVTQPNGLVRGVDGLRVVDASIMPSLPRANTNLPTIMLAEKIADTMPSGPSSASGR